MIIQFKLTCHYFSTKIYLIRGKEMAKRVLLTPSYGVFWSLYLSLLLPFIGVCRLIHSVIFFFLHSVNYLVMEI